MDGSESLWSYLFVRLLTYVRKEACTRLMVVLLITITQGPTPTVEIPSNKHIRCYPGKSIGA
jgi:hypothetical protein